MAALLCTALKGARAVFDPFAPHGLERESRAGRRKLPRPHRPSDGTHESTERRAL